MIPVHSRAVSILPSGTKKWQNSLRRFCHFGNYFGVDLVVILPQFGE